MSLAVSLDQPGLEPSTPLRPEPERDQYGRYVIPDPKTGKRRIWTRATTWAASVKDTHALSNWEIRMTAVGLTQRRDLYAAVAAVADPESDDGKKKLAKLCEAAKEHAGLSRGSNLGTALHSFTQQVDVGRRPIIPPPWDADVAAYQAALKAAGIRVSPNYIERIVVVPLLGVAGTMDRLVEWDGCKLISDLKTGRNLDYSWGEIAIQLSLYAHAKTMFDVEQKRHFKMPEVDQERALVMHLPVGEAQCTIYVVDIHAGWRTAHVCGMVREWRKKKDLARPLEAVTALATAR